MTRLATSRLSRKLLVWLLALSLIPLVLTNAIGYGRGQLIIEQLVSRYLGAVAQEQAQHAKDRIDRQLMLMHSTASGNAFLVAAAKRALGLPGGDMARIATPVALTRVLQAKLGELPGFSALYLISPGGLLIGSAGATGDATVGSPPGGATATTPEASLELIPASAGRAKPLFRLLAPIRDSDDQLVAYLGGAVPLEGFQDVLALPIAEGGDVESFVVDEAGRPLLTRRGTSALDYSTPLPVPFEPTAGLRAVEPYRSFGGKEVFGASATIPGFRWRVVVQAPSAGALDDLRRLGELSIVLEFLMIGLVIATAWLVARELAAPVRRLVLATQQVARGDLSVRVPIDSRDEIGDLGRAFNEMTAALSLANETVQQMHDREIERASQLASVGELASGVAHEIKNPLVGIASGLDLVRRRVSDTAELDPIMDEMSRQLARIQGTIHDLLAFARPTAPTLAAVSAKRAIDRALSLVGPAADRQGVSITVSIVGEVPRFLADEEMLRQALVNLLMNAVQATHNGGRIVIVAERDGDFAQISIRDTGRGIDPRDLDKIFRPFFTTRHTGTGLGLPITKSIVERQGGTLTLESVHFQGTTVWLRFPIREQGGDAGRTA